jgi:hypothetical protein
MGIIKGKEKEGEGRKSRQGKRIKGQKDQR